MKRMPAVSAMLFVASHALAAQTGKIDFNRDIRPIFAGHCVACHGGVKQSSGLSFTVREKAFAKTESGAPAIVPGNPESSPLIERIRSDDDDFRMPPAEHGKPLSKGEIEQLTRWIAEGAKWSEHWSFVPPLPHPPPAVKQATWPRAPVDHFILSRLEKEGLAPSSEADRAAWLRRVSFDLIGLPPTKLEQQAFEQDSCPDACERVVDRLLASPHFGERWTALWLDLARYADTMGYEKDAHRDIWPYRDWLIRAFNNDMPYDEFTVKQLAGDLLPGTRIDDRLASAFHRNTQTNTEGGTDDEEFRVNAVIDRVSATWQVWQGITFGCAQCHSHPYDPIDNSEFYRFLAFFNTSRDIDVPEELPRLNVPKDVARFAEAAALDEQIGTLRRDIHQQVLPLATAPEHWSNLAFDKAEGSETIRLRLAPDATSNAVDFWAEGTPTTNALYTLEAPIPDGVKELTALRIDALPKNVAAAAKIPESGFCLSHIEVELIKPGEEKPTAVPLAAAWCDEPEPTFNPQDSLKSDVDGWADYSRLSRPRFAVFVPAQPLELPPKSRLRFRLRQSRIDSGLGSLAINRGRISISSSRAWTSLLSSTEVANLRKELDDASQKRRSIPAISIPVMQEQAPSAARATHRFIRGNWLDQGAKVEPGVPAVMNGLPRGQTADRLALARWIVAPENPLTARVMVNRVWEQLFGIGIVETPGDFGVSGTRPTHPELLDDLAMRFQRDQEWSLKRLLRSLVLSSTYRQSAVGSPDSIAKDPRNQLLARGPRHRLQAEMIRDQALVLSGRFARTFYGPPVMPPQPDGLWKSVYNAQKWVTATNENRYRRAVYTYWKRTSPYPSMVTFDAPSREFCMVRRVATNTPLQALVTLNDPAFVELAGAFAQRMRAEAGDDPKNQIIWGYEAATGHPPDDKIVGTLLALYSASKDDFHGLPEPERKSAANPEQFAATVVANTILNLDEALTK